MAEYDATGTRLAPGRAGPPPARSSVEVALLDRAGVIAWVNDEWISFGAANGADPRRTGVGASYLDACAAVPADPCSQEVASAIRTALAGDLPAPLQVALACHAPDEARWFDVLVSSRFGDTGACVGATVTLSPVLPARDPRSAGAPPSATDQGPAVPAFYPEQSERLGDVFAQLVLDRAPLGILVVDDHGTVVRAGRGAEQLFGHTRNGLAGMPVRHLLPELDLSGLRDPLRGGPAGTAGPTLLVDGVLADGSVAPLEVRIGQLPLSRGTGAVVLLRDATRIDVDHPPDHVLYLDHEIADLARGLDEVVRHLFGSGLVLTGAAAARRDDGSLSTTLLGVSDDLDHAVREVRAVAFRLQQNGRRTPFGRKPVGDPTAG